MRPGKIPTHQQNLQRQDYEGLEIRSRIAPLPHKEDDEDRRLSRYRNAVICRGNC